jgi:subtilisin
LTRILPAALVLALAASLLAAPVRAESVRTFSIDGKPVPVGQILPTGVDRINAENLANNGAGVHVAVVDTGIDLTHPDLAVVGGVDCVDGVSYQDQNGHGTHVAGIIAALDNGIGVVGVAPEVSLWAIRVLDATGNGTLAQVICGLDFVDARSPANGGPITVANLSLGDEGWDDGVCGSISGDLLHAAICRLVAHGVTVVASAGNGATDLASHVPAAYDEVLAVTNLNDTNGQPCSSSGNASARLDDSFGGRSNYPSDADVAHTMGAPGSVYSTYLGGGYVVLDGTSMAAPHVSGVASLYLATHLGTSPAGVKAALMTVGEPVNVNFKGECGAQRVSHYDPSPVSPGPHPEPVVRVDGL